MATIERYFIVGIDPQPTLLAVHVRDNFDATIAWFKHYFQKKCRFDNAQKWQEHIYDETSNVLQQKIPLIIKAKFSYLSLQQCVPRYVAVEQQKGRVNSIIEQTVLCLCKHAKIEVLILHPMTWKKHTNIPKTGNNKKNKEAVEKIVKPKLQEYIQTSTDLHDTEQLNIVDWDKTKERLHDLCDADKISEACRILTASKQEVTTAVVITDARQENSTTPACANGTNALKTAGFQRSQMRPNVGYSTRARRDGKGTKNG